MKVTEATEPPLQGILKLRWQKSSQMGRLSSPQIAEMKKINYDCIKIEKRISQNSREEKYALDMDYLSD
jgi:hypothetical protein